MDLYEKRRHERRKEDARSSRRYSIGSLLFVVALALLLVLDRMSRDCGYSVFDWEDYRSCNLPEIWDWLRSGAGMNWLFWVAVVIAGAIIITKLQANEDE